MPRWPENHNPERQAWIARLLSVPCPYCHAQVGEACQRPPRSESTQPHGTRVNALMEHLQRPKG